MIKVKYYMLDVEGATNTEGDSKLHMVSCKWFDRTYLEANS